MAAGKNVHRSLSELKAWRNRVMLRRHVEQMKATLIGAGLRPQVFRSYRSISSIHESLRLIEIENAKLIATPTPLLLPCHSAKLLIVASSFSCIFPRVLARLWWRGAMVELESKAYSGGPLLRTLPQSARFSHLKSLALPSR